MEWISGIEPRQAMIFLTLGTFIALGFYGWIRRSRWMVITFGSIPGALLTYYVLGIGTALAMGHGHFFGLPFGGFLVVSDDVLLVTSVVFWLLVWIGVLSLLTRKFSATSP
jgi:hypothetical protein